MNPLAILAFIKANWKAAVGLILGIILCWPVASCSGRADGRAQMRAALVQANIKALAAQRQADTLASQQRITDTTAVNRQEGALRDAIRSTPDTQPDPVRIALGCSRLRASGQDTAHISACNRPSSRAQAGPAR